MFSQDDKEEDEDEEEVEEDAEVVNIILANHDHIMNDHHRRHGNNGDMTTANSDPAAWNDDVFMNLCLRLARNDSSLNFVNKWVDDVGLQNRDKMWNETELMLLGKSLVGNTNLKSFSFRMDSCLCHPSNNSNRNSNKKKTATTVAPFMHAMQQGIAQSQLMALQLVQVCCHFQTCLLQGVGRMHPGLQRLEMCDEAITNMNVLANLLQFQSHDHNNGPSPTISLSPASPSALTHLGLRNCKLDNLDMLALALGLADNRTLRFMNLEKNSIGNVGIAYLCQHYWRTIPPTTTTTGQDDGGDIASIQQQKTMDCPLQDLDLTWNDIGSYGALLLLQASTRNPKFHKLLLTGNGGIGHVGLQHIGEHLGSSHLKFLEIHQVVDVEMPWTEWSQPQPQAAARALANGLRQNTTLIQFHVGGNVLGPPGVQQIMQAVVVHPRLHTLGYACDGSLGFAGLTLVGRELGLTRLKQIHLDGIIMPWPGEAEQNGAAISKTKNIKAARKAGLALMNGVIQNVHMTMFTLFSLTERYMDPIEFYTNVNRLCRPLFRHAAVTPAVWPYILAQFHRDNEAKTKTKSHLYFCLREQPWLVTIVS